MFKKTYAYLAVTMMLTAAAPTLAPALTVQAAAPAQTAQAAFDASALTAQDTAYVISDQSAAARSVRSLGKFTTVNGRTYYKTSDGTNKTGWIRDAGKWYYFDRGDGHMLTGWVKDDGKWYYLDKKDGHMLTGWLIFKNGRKFFLRRDGSMIQGPCWANVGSQRYRFTTNGHVIAAWEYSKGKWYYRDTSGNVVKNRWLYYGGKYYYLTATGATATGTVTIQGKKYSFSKDGDLLGSVPSTVIAAARGSQSTTRKSDGATETNTKTAAAQAVKTTSTSSDSSNGSKTSGTKTASSSASTTKTSSSSSSAASTETTGTKTTASTTKEITKVVGKLNNLSDSRRLFVIQIANYVRKYAPKYDIKVYSPIIAQAIHESGWGESSLSAKYHNYFGLKCGTLWRGKSVNLSTKEEYSAGTLTTIRSNFRVYDNMEEGVKGYFEFIQLARYANLKGVTSPRQYLQNIKNDGYATGSQYVDHTMALINLYNLTQFDN
jgi:flagellum-specific peptidoglycan hydrolase FlgJ